MKSPLFLIPLAVVALSGCGDSGKQENLKEVVESAAAAPDAKPGIKVTDGVLSLPVVKGRPGAAYFALTNGSTAAVTLSAVTIDGAGKAEMHETQGSAMAPLAQVEVKPGETVAFARGGKHVMVFDLADTIKPGASAEMTLTFAGGDKVSVPLKVEAMAGTMDMEGHTN